MWKFDFKGGYSVQLNVAQNLGALEETQYFLAYKLTTPLWMYISYYVLPKNAQKTAQQLCTTKISLTCSIVGRQQSCIV